MYSIIFTFKQIAGFSGAGLFWKVMTTRNKTLWSIVYNMQQNSKTSSKLDNHYESGQAQATIYLLFLEKELAPISIITITPKTIFAIVQLGKIQEEQEVWPPPLSEKRIFLSLRDLAHISRNKSDSNYLPEYSFKGVIMYVLLLPEDLLPIPGHICHITAIGWCNDIIISIRFF